MSHDPFYLCLSTVVGVVVVKAIVAVMMMLSRAFPSSHAFTGTKEEVADERVCRRIEGKRD